jgi:hypothetical protein
MKLRQILLSVVLLAPLSVVSAKAQQVNIFQTCTIYQENYSPGYYDRFGNYVQGNVGTQAYNNQCGNGAYYSNNGGGFYQQNYQQNYQQPYYNRSCAAAPIGTILGGFGAYRATNRVSNRWWSIPLGAITGNIIGNALCN